MSIVLELQRKCLDEKQNLQNLLREALLISTKLNLNDFKEWVNYELKGYEEREDVPKYREVYQSLSFFNPYHGWRTAQMSPEMEEFIGTVKLQQSISELEHLVSTDGENLSISPSASQASLLRDAFNTDFESAFFLSKTSVFGIVETVRNLLLEWTLKLESDGILGDDNMIFTPEEKQTAQTAQTIYIENLGVLGDNAGNVSTGANTTNTINQQVINEEVDKLIEEIENNTNLPDKEEIIINLNAAKENDIELKNILGGLLSRSSEVVTIGAFVGNILSKLG